MTRQLQNLTVEIADLLFDGLARLKQQPDGGHQLGITGRDGDRINAVLAAAGYNFSLLLRWSAKLLRALALILCHALLAAPLHQRWD